MPETTNRKILSDAKAALDGVLNGGQSYSVDGCTYNRANIKDLIELINQYELKVWQETNGDDDGGFIVIRSGRPQ